MAVKCLYRNSMCEILYYYFPITNVLWVVCNSDIEPRHVKPVHLKEEALQKTLKFSAQLMHNHLYNRLSRKRNMGSVVCWCTSA